jgi:GAF domain-containing protein
LTTVAATDQLIWDVDAAQCSAGDGPCVDASSKGQVSRILSMEQEERWPSFSPSARHLGLRAVVSNPLVVGGQPVGAITFYSLTAGAFGAQEVGLASALAAQASAILASAGAGDASNPMGDWRAQALRSRDALFQAVGVVMERDGVSEEDAFTSLRRASERSGSPMRARAAEVLASTQVLSQCVVGRTAERHDA